ncbi:MAG: hypothetical protein ACI97N_001602, partial [Cognaticolwellia sp.]
TFSIKLLFQLIIFLEKMEGIFDKFLPLNL